AEAAGVWTRCRSKPGRSAQADGKTRLWAGQAAHDQGRDPQHRAIPRPGGDPDRPAEHIYIDGELEVVETANWFPKIARKDFVLAANLSGSGVDDPDAYFYEHYACGSERNYTNYCNPELEKMYDQQSMEPDQEKRKKLVWEIDRILTEDAARPI